LQQAGRKEGHQMAKPIVAIVGRPNVGKSTLFNYIAGHRISIVDNTPGVTRDRIYAEAEWRGTVFTIIDTGGIEPESEDNILKQMRVQAEIAVQTADVIIFMVDYKSGLTASDGEVAQILRRASKPVIVTVNKVDAIGEVPPGVYEFYNLGMDELVSISSANALGIGDLLDKVFEYFPKDEQDEFDSNMIKVAIIGKPNAGKSSLVNKILNEERVIVSDVPGTTRDAIDTFVERNGRNYTIIDTAGLRRKSRIEDNIEKYSTIRSWNAVDRADVCLVIIDALDGATEQDTKIAGYAHEQGKASILVINKWDLIEKETGTLEKYKKEVIEKFSFMPYAPVTFISAKTGQRVEGLFEIIDRVNEMASFRAPTGMLNDIINDAVAMAQPPSDKGKRLKIYYMTQVSIKPPTFTVFVNDMELMHFSYKRYLENCIRQSFGYEGTPIRILVRENKSIDLG
jgi:GTP-binding protein